MGAMRLLMVLSLGIVCLYSPRISHGAPTDVTGTTDQYTVGITETATQSAFTAEKLRTANRITLTSSPEQTTNTPLEEKTTASVPPEKPTTSVTKTTASVPPEKPTSVAPAVETTATRVSNPTTSEIHVVTKTTTTAIPGESTSTRSPVTGSALSSSSRNPPGTSNQPKSVTTPFTIVPEVTTESNSTTNGTQAPEDNGKSFGDAAGITIAVILALIVVTGISYYIFLSAKGRPPMSGSRPLIEEHETMDGITNPNFSPPDYSDLELSNSHGESVENGGYVTRPHAESVAGE